MQSATESVVSAVAKTTPPALTGGATVFGIPLPDAVLWATLFYTVVQLAILFNDRLIRPWRKRRKEKKNGS